MRLNSPKEGSELEYGSRRKEYGGGMEEEYEEREFED